jgi:hypothetical protein
MDPGCASGYSRRMRRIPVVLAAIAIAAGVRHAATLALIDLDQLRAGVGAHASPGWSSFVAADRLATAAIGVAAAIAIAWALVRGHRLRWLGALACAGSLAALAIAVVDGGPPLTLAGFVATAVAGAYLVARRGEPPHPRGIGIVAIVALALLAVAAPALRQAWADATDVHRPFVLELRAAEHGGDSLIITGADVGEIRLVDEHWVILHVTDGERARQLMSRSTRRITMRDALYVDGMQITVPSYQNFLTYELPIDFVQRDLAEAFYARVTGR